MHATAESDFRCSRSSQNISILQMEVFVAAAECGSFTQAAAQVQLSQTTLSRCIKELESILGVVLFNRSQKGAVLSGHGLAFLPKAVRLLRFFSEARACMDQWRTNALPSLCLLGSVSVMPMVLPTLLRNLQATFGQAAMHVGEAVDSDVARQVLDGRATLGVGVDIEQTSALRTTPVLQAQFGVLVSAQCVLPTVIDSLRALDGVPLVRCGEEAVVTRALRRRGADFPAYFNSPIIVDAVQAAIELVRDVGMAAITTGLGASHAKAAGLRFIPLPGLLPTARVDIVSRRDALFDGRRERLRDILRASIHETPWLAGVRRLGTSAASGKAFVPVA